MTGMTWGEYRYRVRSAHLVTPVIAELWLEPVAEVFPYRAGQYALLCDGDHLVPQRSYSIANAPRADGGVSLLVTLVPGGPTSTWAHGLVAGDEVLLEGPFGTFVPRGAGPVLLLGAGSGLAPVQAIAEELLRRPARGATGNAGAWDRADATDAPTEQSAPGGRPPRRAITLFFSGRTDADIIRRERLEVWAREHSQFEYRYTRTRQPEAHRHTRIPALLPQEFSSLAGFEVFTAGPPGFVAGCEAAAVALGADASDVHTEEFFPDPAPWHDELPAIPLIRERR